MLKKAKSYHIFLLLLLGGILSLSSCLGCRNASTKRPRSHKDVDPKPDERDDRSTKKPPLDAQTKLMNAVAKGQVNTSALIQLLEQKKVDPIAKDEQGRNVIQNIIHHGTTPDELNVILQQLKQQFPNQEVANQEIAKILNTPDNCPRPNTAFIGAVEKMGEKRNENPIKLVDILFENGARPSPKERKRGLLYCIKLSGLETDETNSGIALFKHLAQKFQELDAPIDQATALAVASAAARTGNDVLMQYILEHPALFPLDAASKDKKGNTLLHYAAVGNGKGQGSQEVIKLLLRQLGGSNAAYINQVNNEGETALYVAAKQALNIQGLHRNVEALLKKGAKVRQEDINMVEDLLKQQPDNQALRVIHRKLTQSFNPTPAIPLDSNPHRMDEVD
jgi:hypothetical protein